MADRRQARSQPSNRMCQMCNDRSPSFYCMCTGLQFFICEDCVPLHYKKSPSLTHMLMPIQLEKVDLSAYQQRLSSFGAGKAELEANLVKIDQSCQELTEAVNSLIASLTQYRDYWVGQLQAWKDALAEDVNQAIAEVQASLADEEVHLTGKYSMFLRNYQPANLVLFNYHINPSSITSGLESLFKTEYLQPKSDPEKVQFSRDLVFIEPKQMKFFNFQRQQWQQPVVLRTTITVDSYSKYTFLDDNRLFCCGGLSRGQGIRETYLINASGEVQPLGLMITARYGHGLIFLPQNVYVFGGYGSERLRKSEMFSVTEPLLSKWRPLPDMRILLGLKKLHTEISTLLEPVCQDTGFSGMSQPRDYFNPCLINGLVFLCGYDSTLMEIFNLATNTFTSSVTLPEGNNSVLLEEAGMLIVISKNYITKYRVQGTTLQQHSQQQHASHCADSASFPVVNDGKVYLSWEGKCRIVDRNSGEQISEIK